MVVSKYSLENKIPKASNVFDQSSLLNDLQSESTNAFPSIISESEEMFSTNVVKVTFNNGKTIEKPIIIPRNNVPKGMKKYFRFMKKFFSPFLIIIMTLL